MARRALHFLRFPLLLAAVLYGAAPGRASEAPEVRANAAPAASAAAPSGETVNAPHLALLLPTGSQSFARAAESVRAGFMQACQQQEAGALPVRLYPINDDPQYVISTYSKALAAGAQAVVGPLTRDGVSALAQAGELITVPTLALNVPEGTRSRPSNLYLLSLQVEAEARQAAQLALSEGRRKAFTVSGPTLLARRMREAFVEEFQRGSGHHIADFAYTTDASALERMRHAAATGVADMVFYAVDAARLRTVRPFMAGVTGYGTSQLNPGNQSGLASNDVADVRFVDMPWMVQPDHPAVMVYARSGTRESDDLERLYALGVDACRLANHLRSGKREIELDGVTGRLTLGPDGRFRRALLVMLIDGGRLTMLGESRP